MWTEDPFSLLERLVALLEAPFASPFSFPTEIEETEMLPASPSLRRFHSGFLPFMLLIELL